MFFLVIFVLIYIFLSSWLIFTSLSSFFFHFQISLPRLFSSFLRLPLYYRESPSIFVLFPPFRVPSLALSPPPSVSSLSSSPVISFWKFEIRELKRGDKEAGEAAIFRDRGMLSLLLSLLSSLLSVYLSVCLLPICFVYYIFSSVFFSFIFFVSHFLLLFYPSLFPFSF